MTDDQKTADVVAALDSQPQIARMFLALWTSQGRGLTYAHLAERIRDMSGGDRPSVDTVRGLASRLARAMRERGWPATITNLPTLGYRLDAPRGWDPFQETDMAEAQETPITGKIYIEARTIDTKPVGPWNVTIAFPGHPPRVVASCVSEEMAIAVKGLIMDRQRDGISGNELTRSPVGDDE